MTTRKPRTPAEALLKLHRTARSWSIVAHDLDENRGQLNAIAHGTRRAPNRVIIKLNQALRLKLPLNLVPAAPCLYCGEVHLRKSKRCPNKTPIGNPRPPRKRYYLREDQWQAYTLIENRFALFRDEAQAAFDKDDDCNTLTRLVAEYIDDVDTLYFATKPDKKE